METPPSGFHTFLFPPIQKSQTKEENANTLFSSLLGISLLPQGRQDTRPEHNFLLVKESYKENMQYNTMQS